MSDESKLETLFNRPIDYIVWLAFFKEKTDGITKYMKTFQLFTSYKKYKELSHFEADNFGANADVLLKDIYEYDQNLINLEEKEFEFNQKNTYEDEDEFSDEYYSFNKTKKDKKEFSIIREVNLMEKVKEKLESVYLALSSNEKLRLEFNFLKAIAKITDNYSTNEITAFCYRMFPEMTTKSRIKGKIMLIPESKIRKIGFDFLTTIPYNFNIYYIDLLKKQLLNISLIHSSLKSDLEKVINSILRYNNIDTIINKARESLIKIINNESHENYKIIVRNILDMMLSNLGKKIENPEKSILLNHLLFLIEFRDSDVKNYYNLIKKSTYGLNLFAK